jgi:hypothetical protein
MSDWVCIPCLLTLRNEFNLVAPKRDKGEEGTIGDVAHAAGGTSDHLPDEDFPKLRYKDSDHKNEVHALDIDATGPWPDGKGGQAGGWFDKQIHLIIAEERRRWLDPNDMCRLEYIIWRGMIYDKDRDWAGVKYNGTDQHFGHAHFSGRYETRAESDTRTWGVYVPPKPTTPTEDFMSFITNRAQFQAEMTAWAKTPEGAQALLTGLMGAKYGSDVYPTRKLVDFFKDLHGERDWEIGDTTGSQAKFSKVGPTSPLAQLHKKVDEMAAEIANMTPHSA